MRYRMIAALPAFAMLVASISAVAAVPGLINLQGRLTDAASNPLPDASYSVTFRIYDNAGPGGTVLWSEVTSVTTADGLFTRNLGSVTPIPTTVFNNPDRWLGIQVQGFGEMIPRTQLTSVAYALETAQWNSLGNDLYRLNGGVGIGTNTTPSQLNLFAAPSPSQLNFTQSIASAGLNIATQYSDDNYTPGVFWSTENNNPGRPKAGIYLREMQTGTEMHFGTSNSYPAGITNSAVVISPEGNVGVGTAPFDDTRLVVRTGAPAAVNAGSTRLNGIGVIGQSYLGSQAIGVWGGSSGLAGNFSGDVHVNGTLSKTAGSFKMDHPLDPANKYLSHSFVESSDMMNIYNGVITTDAEGDAAVTMPEWFEALNKDFRYQLTVIGQFAQAIVSKKVAGNQFAIKTDKPNVEVSWQVTGIRQDAYANAHRIPVEVMKSDKERGYYQHPELFSQPEEKGIEWARRPEMMKQMKDEREKAKAESQK